MIIAFSTYGTVSPAAKIVAPTFENAAFGFILVSGYGGEVVGGNTNWESML
jgi:hypothetical protein